MRVSTIILLLVTLSNTAWAKVEQEPNWDSLTVLEAYNLLEAGQYDANKVSNGGDTALHNAVKKQDLNAVKLALFIGLDPAMSNKAGDTPLHLAAAKKNLSIVQVLIENNAPIQWQNKLGNTPLHNAAAEGNLTIVQYLLENGAPLSILNAAEQSPYHKALAANNEEVLACLIEHGHIPGDPEADLLTSQGYSPTATKDEIFLQAVEKENFELVKKLIVNLKEPSLVLSRGLYTAVKKGNAKMVQLFLDSGTKVEWTAYYSKDSPNLPYLDYETLLHEAVKNKKGVILALLLTDEHLLLNARDDHGATALHYAVANGDLYAVQKLIERGADVNKLSASEWKRGTVAQDYWTDYDWDAWAGADSALPHHFEKRQEGWVHPVLSPLSLALERHPHNAALLDLLRSHDAKEHYEPSSWEKNLRF